ncbi:hypothetical protein [Rhizobium leguminosarum]|uniref:hypothetical protein n=1 Tax=Rhizobium leguminosarum TaxID=384 RepID=UPI0004201530|nr:hypothetical protein [Rhizobium leguminosarum]
MTLPIDSQMEETARITENRNFQDLPVGLDPAPAGQEHAIGVIAFSKEKTRQQG